MILVIKYLDMNSFMDIIDIIYKWYFKVLNFFLIVDIVGFR